MGIGEHLLERLRRLRRQDQAGGDRRARRSAEGEVRRRHRDHPDAARRGQDDDHGRPRPGDEAHRQEADDQPPPTVDGPDVRHQGRCGRRRLQPGDPDGAAQPPPDRRLPRRDRGPQPARRRWSTTTSIRATSSGLDLHNITWRRVLDVNDRALRNIVIGLGTKEDGVIRQSGFDITAASEVMAVLALSTSVADMRARLGRIVVGYTKAGEPVTAEQLHGAGSMAVIMREALKPNLLADARAHAGDRARRAVRQHRPRQLLDRRRPHRHPHRRVPDHRGRVRRRHGRRAVLQHQVPQLRAGARRRGARRHRAGAEGPLRQVQDRRRQAAPGRAARREPRRRPCRRGQPASSRSRT